MDTKFSGLTRIDLALEVAVPVPLMDRLERARSRSAELGRPVAILLGDPPIRVHAHPQGTRGGYRYRCSANRGSETWKFRATRSPGWNCLLEFHNAARRPLTSWELFLRFGRIRRALRLSPSMTRVSRLDCAAELVMPPGFSPDPTRFSAHARTRLRRQHHALSEAIHSDTPVSAVWRGRRVRALRCRYRDRERGAEDCAKGCRFALADVRLDAGWPTTPGIFVPSGARHGAEDYAVLWRRSFDVVNW